MLVWINYTDEDGINVDGVANLLQHDDELVDEDGKVWGTVGDLYKGDLVIVETDEGIFGLEPTRVHSITPYTLPDSGV